MSDEIEEIVERMARVLQAKPNACDGETMEPLDAKKAIRRAIEGATAELDDKWRNRFAKYGKILLREKEKLQTEIASLRQQLEDVTHHRDLQIEDNKRFKMRIAELAQQLQQAQADTERLDWLGTNQHRMQEIYNACVELMTIRAAIDEARNKKS